VSTTTTWLTVWPSIAIFSSGNPTVSVYDNNNTLASNLVKMAMMMAVKAVMVGFGCIVTYTHTHITHTHKQKVECGIWLWL
jgi:hypothetical protein